MRGITTAIIRGDIVTGRPLGRVTSSAAAVAAWRFNVTAGIARRRAPTATRHRRWLGFGGDGGGGRRCLPPSRAISDSAATTAYGANIQSLGGGGAMAGSTSPANQRRLRHRPAAPVSNRRLWRGGGSTRSLPADGNIQTSGVTATVSSSSRPAAAAAAAGSMSPQHLGQRAPTAGRNRRRRLVGEAATAGHCR